MRKCWLLLLLMFVMTTVVLTGCSSQADYSSLKVGQIVKFGNYDCRVLEVQDGKALLITNEIVAKKGFYRIQNDPEHPNKYTTASSTVWADSTLRDYLNSEFYDSFDEKSKALILKTTVKNDDFDPGNYHSVYAGPDTEDYIFCLSMDEAYAYFDGLDDRAAKAAEGVDADKETSTNWWWLRTPGKGHAGWDGAWTNYFQFVGEDGEVHEYGNEIQYELGVRPAFWIDTTTSK